jgi:hypothetical protein
MELRSGSIYMSKTEEDKIMQNYWRSKQQANYNCQHCKAGISEDEYDSHDTYCSPCAIELLATQPTNKRSTGSAASNLGRRFS